MLCVNRDGFVLDSRQTLENYIINSDGFICSFARHALQHGRIDFVELPDVASCALGDFHKLIRPTFGRFAAHETDAIILTERDDPENHEKGLTRCWSIYVHAYVGFALADNPSADIAALYQEAMPKAKEYLLPETMHNYFFDGELKVGEQKLIYIVMNPLYSAHPQIHPRYSPTTSYIFTRADDVSDARTHAREKAIILGGKMLERSEMPYLGSLPYIIPNDLHFAHPGYINTLRKVMSLMLSGAAPKLRPGELLRATRKIVMVERALALERITNLNTPPSEELLTDDQIVELLRKPLMPEQPQSL